ncbi:MAG: hypothetical protein SPI20_03690 [Ruminococcus callidus]|nr:hypothetical protein [Ruminococcus callidus]
MIVSSKVALQNHSIVRVQTVAKRQSLFSFACFSFFSKKKPDEKDDSMLSLPNGNLFFLLPTFPFSAKRNQMKKMIPCFPCRTAISFFFCLLFFFQQKEK